MAAVARSLALGSGAAAVVIAVLVLRDGLPEGGEETAEVAVALVLAAAPPAVLGAFWLAVRELVGLPARLRALPGTGREQASELARLASEARARRGGWRSPRVLWRFATLAGSARETLTPWAPLLPLLSVPFLLLTAFAAAAALLEIVVALVALAVVAI